MIDTKEELENYNRRQLAQGKRKDGSDITPEYKPMTIFLKQQKGQPWDRVTLEDTGAFYRDIDLEVGSTDYDLMSKDYKAPQLMQKYGEDIMGLSEPNKDEYRADTLKPRIVTAICAKTGAIAK